MALKKTIAVIGATGNMGVALSKSLAKGNYRLLLMANHAERLNLLYKEIKTANTNADVEVIQCAMNASWEADFIILAVPYQAEKEIADKIREVSTGKIVISLSNPVNSSFSELVTSSGSSAAEELQQLLPHSLVIKAFNTTFAKDFYSPVIDGKQVDSFIAGDDAEALESVAEMVKMIGFNPVVAGGLKVSRTLEAMQLLLMQLTLKYDYNWQAGWKILHQ
jgi:NADPH-dependent F420 reductase